MRSRVKAVWVGGAIAGALDLLFAISFSASQGVPPVRVLQSVSSGLLGTGAYSGGTTTAAAGVALHFGMALLWATLFMIAATQAPAVARRPVIAGAVFGVLVFLTMRLVVLPLSAFPHPVIFRPLATVLDLLSHMFLFGVPIAWAARRAVGP
jgi:uncharacterized membrane protein YagU involved in acid resistance